MDTNELTDRMHEAADNAIVRFRKPKPWRTIEIESRPKARQVVQMAYEIADLMVGDFAAEIRRQERIQAKDIAQYDAETTGKLVYISGTNQEYRPFAALAEVLEKAS